MIKDGPAAANKILPKEKKERRKLSKEMFEPSSVTICLLVFVQCVRVGRPAVRSLRSSFACLSTPAAYGCSVDRRALYELRSIPVVSFSFRVLFLLWSRADTFVV